MVDNNDDNGNGGKTNDNHVQLPKTITDVWDNEYDEWWNEE